MITTVTETREVCSLCGGRGQVAQLLSCHDLQPCRLCQGSGQLLVRVVTETKHDVSEIVDEVQRQLAQRLSHPEFRVTERRGAALREAMGEACGERGEPGVDGQTPITGSANTPNWR